MRNDKIPALLLILASSMPVAVAAQEPDAEQPAVPAEEPAAEEEVPVDVDEESYLDIDEEDFRPSEEIDADQSIPFPTDI